MSTDGPLEAAESAPSEILADSTVNGGVSAIKEPSKKRNNRRKPNYVLLHKDVLPLEVFPLPVFHPTNPLSLLQLVWTYIWQLALPPRSCPSERYVGYFSPATRSIHITDPKHVRGLWERGFFGKGTLSRSEPSWMDREKARLAARSRGGQTAEEATKARREERRLFKLERARLESERIEQQRLLEQGKVARGPVEAVDAEPTSSVDDLVTSISDNTESELQGEQANVISSEAFDEELTISDQEHLQLTLEEAFFLSFGLGVLDIKGPDIPEHTNDGLALFRLFNSTSKFISADSYGTDDQFILNYVVYHHFRSLGWVVRPGVKFSVDYLLYNRGPVFSHAEFAILIMPSYSDAYWSTTDGQSKRKHIEQRDWWWLHCINRVQSQVKKTLVLCYVEIPPPVAYGEEISVKTLLSRYKVREFILRRWLMNRMRD